jgi:tetratricopeptide (TPR) repeat protein
MNQMRGLALVGKTRALRHLGRFPEALAVADENLEIVRASSEVSPEDTLLAHTYHAGVLVDLARFDDALTELDGALQARHEDGLDHAIGAAEAERARVLDELGRRSDARIAATRALAAVERAVPRDAQLLANARTALAKLGKSTRRAP